MDHNRAAASIAERAHDPVRRAVVDVVAAGEVFLDVVLAGVNPAPTTGEEVWAQDVAYSPGGIANVIVASARLGASTALAAEVGSDRFGQWCCNVLTQEGVDTVALAAPEGSVTALTVSVASGEDRMMVTHAGAHQVAPTDLVASLPSGRVALGYLNGALGRVGWWHLLPHPPEVLIADVGWDPTGRWEGVRERLPEVDVFLPGLREALALTGADTAEAAATRLLEQVPVVVITDGERGVLLGERGQELRRVPALQVDARDATGAGDVFAGALAGGIVHGLGREQQVDLAVLASALSVQGLGGAMGAPTVEEMLAWREQQAEPLQERYTFLSDLPATGRIAQPAPMALPLDPTEPA